jgi:arylsulfatase A-like enzyme
VFPRAARLAGILTLAALPQVGGSERTETPAPPRPNFVVVLLDDADAEITEAMPRLRSLFIEKGVRFTSNIASTPLCGPARAVILSGEYAHNNRVYYNNGAEGGYGPWSSGGYDANNLATRLKGLGYRTGLFGKYMNDFPLGRPEAYVPQGWDDFRGVLSDREAHNNRYTLNENGTLKVYEAGSGGYQTDLLSDRLDSFLRDGKSGDARPFFALLAVSAPHIPPEPAARHLKAFASETAPRKPSFDEADLSDKPTALREQATPITAAQAGEIDATYRAMKQSLLSVEEAVEKLIQTLTETGALSRTYVFLTSDNGWMRGEHRIPAEKYAPYEESIRVPLMVRGPGVFEGLTLDQVVGLVDLDATLLDLAGSPAPTVAASDGRSFAPLLNLKKGEAAPWRESILIEHFGGGAPYKVRGYSGLRSRKATYVEYATGEKEYYDLEKDPYQLENTAARLEAATLAALHARVTALKNCKGPACRSAEGATTLIAR